MLFGFVRQLVLIGFVRRLHQPFRLECWLCDPSVTAEAAAAKLDGLPAAAAAAAAAGGSVRWR